MTRGARARLAAVPAALVAAACSGGSTPPGLTCDAGQHACAVACVSDASPLTCGARCDPCPATEHGAATCAAGACGLSCDDGYAPCQSGCCATAGGEGAVRFGFTWPEAGAPLAAAARLELAIGGQVVTLDAPATAVRVDGLAPGRATFVARLLDGQGAELARGGGAAVIEEGGTFTQGLRAGAEGLADCAIADEVPGDDLVVSLGAPRTLAGGALDEDGVVLLLTPEELAWAGEGAEVATLDPVTGRVAPVAPGHLAVTLRCGVEIPSFLPRAHATAGVRSASAVVFVRDPASADAAPTAALAVDPAAADYDFTFRLDASATSDDGGAAALRWRFDWEGDGRWDTPFATAPVRFHKYAYAGSFHPTVQVVDAGGRTGRAARDLPVAEPVGVRVAVDPASWTLWLNVRPQVLFTATVTGAADASVTWSVLEGDDAQRWGGCVATTATTCLYEGPVYGGLYHLVATAVADPAKKAMAEIDVRNQTPAADCHVEAGQGVWTDWAILGMPVLVDGQRSRDPEGRALRYAWWYLEGGLPPRIDLDGADDVISVRFDTQGLRTLGLDVTDPGGEVGSNGCGDVTWAPSRGIPIAEGGNAGYWQDAAGLTEYAFVADGGSVQMAYCTRTAGQDCWHREYGDTCQVDGTGIAAPRLECGTGAAFVVGPEGDATHLWFRWTPSSNWRPADPRASPVGKSPGVPSCWAGPFCP